MAIFKRMNLVTLFNLFLLLSDLRWWMLWPPPRLLHPWMPCFNSSTSPMLKVWSCRRDSSTHVALLHIPTRECSRLCWWVPCWRHNKTNTSHIKNDVIKKSYDIIIIIYQHAMFSMNFNQTCFLFRTFPRERSAALTLKSLWWSLWEPWSTNCVRKEGATYQ